MFLANNYTTDSNYLLAYSVALYIGYDGESPRQEIVIDSLIPPILIPQLKWFARPCATKQVISRYVLITLVSGNILKIAYPFRPNTPEWNAFWEQLQSPNIISVKGIGESVTDKLIRSSLNL